MILDSSYCADLSIVVPVLNEQENLVELHRRLTHVLGLQDGSYEIIFVDDGSTDGSVRLGRELAELDPHVAFVELRRNFGKATALQAGFQVATGQVIITMDGDLQDDPDEIPHFLESLQGGFDLVSGWKKNRCDPLSKTLPSRVFNFVTSLLTDVSLRDFNCGFKAYRREVVETLDLYGELHRYIPVLAHAKGFRVGEIPVLHHPRFRGKSKYSVERFLRGAFDLITILFLSTFQRRPLHLFGLIGLLFVLAGSAIDGYLSVLWFLKEPIGNRPLLVLGTLLITLGIQVLIFGLLAEMITATTYHRREAMKLVRKVHRQTSYLLQNGDRAIDREHVDD
jgi:glycosyltransferase involved in cell wall biosynthesis